MWRCSPIRLSFAINGNDVDARGDDSIKQMPPGSSAWRKRERGKGRTEGGGFTRRKKEARSRFVLEISKRETERGRERRTCISDRWRRDTTMSYGFSKLGVLKTSVFIVSFVRLYFLSGCCGLHFGLDLHFVREWKDVKRRGYSFR